LTEHQRADIVKSLNDPAQSIFIAAKHLSDLRNVDNPEKSGKDLTPDDIKIIGARYNQGPDKSLAEIKKDLSYGETIVKRWSTFTRLLSTAPPRLEYAPIRNNIVKPFNRAVGDLDWNIRHLYGAP
jgi:hypothetical protein